MQSRPYIAEAHLLWYLGEQFVAQIADVCFPALGEQASVWSLKNVFGFIDNQPYRDVAQPRHINSPQRST